MGKQIQLDEKDLKDLTEEELQELEDKGFIKRKDGKVEIVREIRTK